MVDTPTHLYKDTPHSCLDLIASSFDQTATTFSTMAPIGNSDHLCIHCTIPFNATCTIQDTSTSRTAQEVRWSWTATRVAALQNDLVRKLETFDESWASAKSVDDLWQQWQSTLLASAQHNCALPSTSTPRKGNNNSPYPSRPWISPELVSQIRLKHKLHRQYLQDRTSARWQTFTTQRNLVTRLLREAKSKFIMSTEQELSLPRLHTLTCCLRKQKARAIPDIQTEHGPQSTSSDKASAFNTFFISQSKKSIENSTSTVPEIRTPPVTDNLLLREFAAEPKQVPAHPAGPRPQ